MLSFPVALLCEAACPLDGFQWALRAGIHLWSWQLVHLPPPFTSSEAATAGIPAVCHPRALPCAGQPPSPVEMRVHDIATVNLQRELG